MIYVFIIFISFFFALLAYKYELLRLQNDEILKNYNKELELELTKRTQQLKEKSDLLQKQNQKLEENEHQLKLLNETLNVRVEQQIEEIRQKEQLLIQQSKLVTMGEMIGNIAHQWRQPLSALNITIDNIAFKQKLDKLTEETLNKHVQTSKELIKYMSNTIDDFRNFFKPSKDKEVFDIVSSIYHSSNIVIYQLNNHNIKLTINNHTKSELKIEGYQNEFKHVFINLINNAKDAILEKNINNGNINIDIYNNENIQIDVTDNAGGIPNDIINKIFEPYFTTKFSSQGTGLGLYMAKTIIEHNMNGKLLVKNIQEGARFSIILQNQIIL